MKALTTRRMAVEINSWDTAILKAQLKIKELRLAIGIFQAKKKAAEPWADEAVKEMGRRG